VSKDETSPDPIGGMSLAPIHFDMKSAKTDRPAREIDRPDAVLKEKVEAALKRDHDKKLDGLTVVDVNHGLIHMEGTGVTMTGRLRAVELAWKAAEEAASNEEIRRRIEPRGQNPASKEKDHDMATQTSDPRDERRTEGRFSGGLR
jgi:hypothetical protein